MTNETNTNETSNVPMPMPMPMPMPESMPESISRLFPESMPIAASNLLITWSTRNQGNANESVSFSLTAAPCDTSTFPAWVLTQCQADTNILTAVADAVILALKPACQRIAKESLNRTMTADFDTLFNAFVFGGPSRTKYLDPSEAEALADVLIPYWVSEGNNASRPIHIHDTARVLLIGALTNKTPKGTHVSVLVKVRESWATRLRAAGIEVPPALIPPALDDIDESAF